MTGPRVAVVGAGAFGGWAALGLVRRGARVTLIDAWGPGNARSSSGGASRVLRAVYGRDRLYVEMVRRALELWRDLEAASGERLYVGTGALWMHRADDAYLRSALPILGELGFPVDELPVAEAARRYPQIDFSGIGSVWLERRAGVLRARRACALVRDALVAAGGTYRTGHAVPPDASGGGAPGLTLADGTTLAADAVVFACGPWLGRLFPDVVGDRVRPTRQEVFHFGVPPGSDRFAPGRFPVWLDFGERIVYGLPDVDGRGVKLADDTRGAPFDPTAGDRTPSPEGLARVRRLLAHRFPELADAPLLAARVCQYANTPDGNLLLDRHPGLPDVWLVGGGSGHGFKLSPALGELTAACVLGEKEPPAAFRLERGAGGARRTQFEAGAAEGGLASPGA